MWYNNVKRYEYDYDVNGNLYKVVDIANDTVLVYSYDDQNRVTKMIECDASTLDLALSVWQSYNEQSLIQSVIYSAAYGSGSAFNYSYFLSYNSQNNLTQMSIDVADDYDQSGSITYTYDELQRATLKTVSFKPTDSTGVSVSTGYEYKTVGTGTSYLISRYVSTVKNLANNATVSTNTYNYTYDANGNITQITNASGVVQNKYYYDDIGQLIREDNAAFSRAYVYTYDNAGNRTSKKTYELPNIETGTLGALQSTETYSYPDNPEYEYWGDQLQSIDGVDISYDNVGNPLDYCIDGMVVELAWEGRQLVGITEVIIDAFEYTYEYNDEGIRTSKTIDGVEYKYTLNGSQIVAQEWEDKLIVFFYDESGSPIGYAYRTTSMAADTFYYYVFEKNLQGDIVAIYNTSGTKLISYTYDAWGNVSVSNINISGTNAGAQYNPFRYRGYYYDEEVRLYYLNSRYYDPSTGRFLNADVIDVVFATPDALTDKNLYAYCDNNPIMRADNGGEFWHILGGAVLGAAVGAASKIVINLMNGYDWKQGLGTAALAGAISGGFAASGAGLATQVVVNALAGAGNNALDQWNEISDGIRKEPFDIGEVMLSGAIGAVAGFVGGAGAGTKSLTNMGVKTLTRTGKALIHKGVGIAKETFKHGISYFAKNARHIINPVISAVAKSTTATLFSNALIALSD